MGWFLSLSRALRSAGKACWTSKYFFIANAVVLRPSKRSRSSDRAFVSEGGFSHIEVETAAIATSATRRDNTFPLLAGRFILVLPFASPEDSRQMPFLR